MNQEHLPILEDYVYDAPVKKIKSYKKPRTDPHEIPKRTFYQTKQFERIEQKILKICYDELISLVPSLEQYNTSHSKENNDYILIQTANYIQELRLL